MHLPAAFQNTDRALWPGQFVRVALRLTTRPDAVILPNQAVQTGQEGQFVYVVKADKTVEFRPVVTGARIDQDLVIEKGVQPGETVVTEGQLRLAPGSRIMLRDERGPRPGGGRRNRALYCALPHRPIRKLPPAWLRRTRRLGPYAPDSRFGSAGP